jgi:hypothetical protein
MLVSSSVLLVIGVTGHTSAGLALGFVVTAVMTPGCLGCDAIHQTAHVMCLAVVAAKFWGKQPIGKWA